MTYSYPLCLVMQQMASATDFFCRYNVINGVE